MFRPTAERAAVGPRVGPPASGAPTAQARIPPFSPWAAKDLHRVLSPGPERLPWPQAVLLIGLLSLALWALIAVVVLLVIR